MIHEAGYRQGQCEVCWREDIDNIPPAAEQAVFLHAAFYSIECRFWSLCAVCLARGLKGGVGRTRGLFLHDSPMQELPRDLLVRQGLRNSVTGLCSTCLIAASKAILPLRPVTSHWRQH